MPICVDMDGTLVRGNLLLESALSFLRHHWGRTYRLIGWLAKGRARLKRELATVAEIDPALLPYNHELIDWLKARKDEGRQLILVSAGDALLAERVAGHVGLFKEVIASDGVRNLKGRTKADFLVKRFGERGFIYAGDSRADVAVWRKAAAAIIVNAPRSVESAAKKATPVAAHFPRKYKIGIEFLRSLRLYQWIKNILVFIPAIAAHRFDEPEILVIGLTIFLAFGLAASGSYLINDVLDLNADRAHPRKKERPFAAGSLPLGFGLFGPLLLIAGISTGFAISMESGALVALYVAMTLGYSAYFKQKALMDVFVLAALYTLRLLTGGVAIDTLPSIWLLSFSGFLFLALALLKRSNDVRASLGTPAGGPVGRGYITSDLAILEMMGLASSFSSCLVLALYVESNVAALVYRSPLALWGILPFILYWNCRLWLTTARGQMTDDPILFTARDPQSWLVILSVVGIYIAATLGVPFL